MRVVPLIKHVRRRKARKWLTGYSGHWLSSPFALSSIPCGS